jgi:tight adherence protein C
MIILAIIGLVLLGLAIGLAAWAIILPRSQAALRVQQIEAYGFAAQASGGAQLETSERQSVVGLLARRIGEFLAQHIRGAATEEDVRQHLIRAGMYSSSPRTVLGYRVLAFVALGFVGSVLKVLHGTLGHVAIGALLAYIGWRIPVILLERRAKARQREIDYALPDVIDQIVITLEAGVGFGSSMQLAADQLKGPLGVELRLTLQEQRMGLGMRGALQNLLQRTDSANMRTFVRAVTQGETLGVSIGVVMRNLAVEMRKKRRQQAEERAQRAPVKLLFPLIFLIFPAMFVVVLGPAVISITDTLTK